MFNCVLCFCFGFEPAFTLTGNMRPEGLVRGGTVNSRHSTLRRYLLLYVVYMRAPDETPGGTPRPPKTSTVVLLLGTIADTTWRMFVPTVTFILLGFWADESWGTIPWMTVLGIIVGTGVTSLLIKRQLEEVKRTK